MRELVYLSEAKLKQFVAGRPRRLHGRAQVEGELTVPGIGGLRASSAAPDQNAGAVAELKKVISALEKSDRAARWFADSRVQPGQWVHFDLPLCYTTIADRGARAVVFLGSDEPADGSSTVAATRLLLHGSAEHLLDGQDGDAANRDGWRSPVRYTQVRQFIHLLYRLNRHSTSSDSEPDADELDLRSGRFLEGDVHEVFELLEDALAPRLTAAWMAGYARVTAVLREEGFVTVLATPLYVEYAPQPAQDQ